MRVIGARAQICGWAVLTCALLVLGGRVLAEDAQAATGTGDSESAAISWGYEVDYNGRYVWHGLAWTSKAIVQPSAWVTARGLTFTVWANRSLEGVDGAELDEVDYTLSWEQERGGVTLEPSVDIYTYPNQQDSPGTAMANLRISWPAGPLTAFTTHSFDVHEYRGAYFGEVGLCFEKELSDRASLESSLSLGWASSRFNEAYIGPRSSAFNVGTLDVGLTFTAANGVYIRPHISATRILSNRLRAALDDPDIASFGVAIGKEY